jgi:hypothetical protein
MPMTRNVKWSLMAQRLYVILMIGLVFVKSIHAYKGVKREF